MINNDGRGVVSFQSGIKKNGESHRSGEGRCGGGGVVDRQLVNGGWGQENEW